MKFRTALYILFSSLIFILFSFTLLSAQTFPLEEVKETYKVTVSTKINHDIYSQLSLVPEIVEVREPASVNISLLFADGTPNKNRKVEIYIKSGGSTVTIVQPELTNSQGKATGSISSTVPGTYLVCAKDITEGDEIFIEDCKTLYVIPVPPPLMVEEPLYTPSNLNTVMWSHSGTGQYQYYTEVSRLLDFSIISNKSGWIDNQTYTFKNLSDGQIYFYRVKARNAYGGESVWSNIVFSVQDVTPPVISVIQISDIGENTTTEWDRDFLINIKYRIKDNIEISRRDFWCVRENGERYDCPYTAQIDGDFWIVSIKLKDLENDDHIYLYNEYRFCVEAADLVNNVSRNCDAKLRVPDFVGEELPPEDVVPPLVPPKPPVEKPKPTIPKRLKKEITDLIDTTISTIGPDVVEDITVITTTVNTLVGLVSLLILANIPSALLRALFALLSLFGFRKKENVIGYVYNSATKNPIPQAIVRVFNSNHELVWTDVTDSNGYYRGGKLDDGEYYIQVTARDFIFPSNVILSKTDSPLENIYRGDFFLPEKNTIPNFSIPLDPVELSKRRMLSAKVKSRTKVLLKVLQILLFCFGLLFSILALYITRVWWNYFVIALYIIPLIGLLKKRDKYGVVYDEEKNLLEGIIVGLNEMEFGKLISKRVTDADGRYRFIVDKGVYELTILNSNFKPKDSISLSNISIDNEGPNILCPDIYVFEVDDVSREDDLLEPLDEL